MSESRKNFLIIFVVLATVAIVVSAKHLRNRGSGEELVEVDVVASQTGLPILVDLGSVTCIPCKMMMPILEELEAEYADRLVVKFIDVKEDKSAGPKYGIRVIPTQIFYDGQGRELFRHEGFYSKEEILAKWKEFGFDLSREE